MHRLVEKFKLGAQTLNPAHAQFGSVNAFGHEFLARGHVGGGKVFAELGNVDAGPVGIQ